MKKSLRILRKGMLCMLYLLCVCALTACSASSVNAKKQPLATGATAFPEKPLPANPATAEALAKIPASWQPLVQRLQQDHVADATIVQYFHALADYSPEPMSVKVKELYKIAYGPKGPKKPVDPNKPVLPPTTIYRNIVTQATLEKCNAFIAKNKTYLDGMEKKYPVPKEVIVALLFVETRLGTFMGNEKAFWSLACMATADKPEKVKEGVKDLPLTAAHDKWLQAKLTDKSDWAYKELKALLSYCKIQDIDPHALPGSVYGAIGICQFMPSNLKPYGDDGDGDGVINLFSEADAIYSAARYLTKHGWKKDSSVAEQRKVLKRYNNITRYANTILALGETVRTGVLQTAAPDAVKVAPKKAAPKKGGVKKPAPKKPAPKKATPQKAPQKKSS